MPLVILGKTPCMICGHILQPNDDIGATSAFISDRSDPLWPYSDAAFHRSCFAAWDHRAEFQAKYEKALEIAKAMRPENI